MNKPTKQALLRFTRLVATAIARQLNGKDVDWREMEAQEALETHKESLDL